MSTTNNAVLKALRTAGYEMDVLVAGAASTQGTATRITKRETRCIKSVANGSFILPSLLSEEAIEQPYYVINDTAGAILVYCAAGETNNLALIIYPPTSGPLRRPSSTLTWRRPTKT